MMGMWAWDKADLREISVFKPRRFGPHVILPGHSGRLFRLRAFIADHMRISRSAGAPMAI
jgi:hypothetical protein